MLKKRRFRAHAAGDAVAAEKGYLREAGNLVFHVALIVMLVAFAVGSCSSPRAANSSSRATVSPTPSPSTTTSSPAPCSRRRTGAVQFQPRQVHRYVRQERAAAGHPAHLRGRRHLVEGHRARGPQGRHRGQQAPGVDGTKVYLLVARLRPVVTIRDGKGKVVFKARVPLLPIDNNVTSTGVIKVMDGYRDKNGQEGTARLPGLLRADVRRRGPRPRCSRSSPALEYPVLDAQRLPRQPRRRLRRSAERVPAGHPQDEAVQGLQGRACSSRPCCPARR